MGYFAVPGPNNFFSSPAKSLYQYDLCYSVSQIILVLIIDDEIFPLYTWVD